jgi:hypothetical protein
MSLAAIGWVLSRDGADARQPLFDQRQIGFNPFISHGAPQKVGDAVTPADSQPPGQFAQFHRSVPARQGGKGGPRHMPRSAPRQLRRRHAIILAHGRGHLLQRPGEPLPRPAGLRLT